MHREDLGRQALYAAGGRGQSLLRAASARERPAARGSQAGGEEAREREAAVTDRSDARAVVVTGAYGTGKSSLVEEIADILEHRRVRYGALDLDWLGWFDPGFGDGDHDAGFPVKLKNVDAVGDLVIESDRPIREVVTEVLSALGW
jgi:hypothetical protein